MTMMEFACNGVVIGDILRNLLLIFQRRIVKFKIKTLCCVLIVLKIMILIQRLTNVTITSLLKLMTIIT